MRVCGSSETRQLTCTRCMKCYSLSVVFSVKSLCLCTWEINTTHGHLLSPPPLLVPLQVQHDTSNFILPMQHCSLGQLHIICLCLRLRRWKLKTTNGSFISPSTWFSARPTARSAVHRALLNMHHQHATLLTQFHILCFCVARKSTRYLRVCSTISS